MRLWVPPAIPLPYAYAGVTSRRAPPARRDASRAASAGARRRRGLSQPCRVVCVSLSCRRGVRGGRFFQHAFAKRQQPGCISFDGFSPNRETCNRKKPCGNLNCMLFAFAAQPRPIFPAHPTLLLFHFDVITQTATRVTTGGRTKISTAGIDQRPVSRRAWTCTMVLVSTPSHTRALAEGARFVTTERSTGAGKVAMPSARAPLKVGHCTTAVGWFARRRSRRSTTSLQRTAAASRRSTPCVV